MGNRRYISPTTRDTQREKPVPRGTQETPKIASPAESDNNEVDKHADPTTQPAPGCSSESSPVLELTTKQVALAKSIGDVVIAGKSFSSTLNLPIEAMRKAFEESQRFAESAAVISKSSQAMWSPLLKSVQDSLYPISKLAVAWSRTYESFLKEWHGVAKRISEAAKAANDLVVNFKIILVASGWPPPTMDFDIADMRYVVEAHNSLAPNKAKAQIDAFMLERHNSYYVSTRLSDWKHHKWITDRIPILTAVVNAHIQEQYALSVPAILSQIEGIIWEGYDYRGRVCLKEEKVRAKLLCKNGLDFLDEIAEEFFLNTVLHDFDAGQPIPELSRHAILHGFDTHYATATNSLKLILLFDYFLGAFGVVSLETSTAYHKLGCPHIQRSLSHRTVYSSHQSAQRAGKQPCKLCHPEHL